MGCWSKPNCLFVRFGPEFGFDFALHVFVAFKKEKIEQSSILIS